MLLPLIAAFVLSGLIAWPLTQAVAQAPFVDGQVKPSDQEAVISQTPRSRGMPRLFGEDNRVLTSPLDVARLLMEDGFQQGSGPQRMGVVQKFAPVLSSQSGRWTRLADGGWLWTMSFVAPGARGVRLHIDPWRPPPDAELFIYSPSDPLAVRGPITVDYLPGSDDLWTPTIYAEEVNLEYYLPPGTSRQSPGAQIAVTGLLNQYRSPIDGLDPVELACHLDVSCYSLWQNEADGVAALSYVSNQFGFFCSGALMNRIGGDFTPLLTTAFHCGVRANNAASMLALWFFQTNSCNGTVPNLNTLPQTQGVTLLVLNNANDYTLVGLSPANLGGVLFSGWDAGTWADGASTIIHHPRGTFKRITFGTKNGTWGSCIGGAGAGYAIINPDGSGEIEPGSSGSPIFDTSKRIRGTGSCANWACGVDNGATYGRFDLAWSVLWPFLSPTDPVYLNASFAGTETGTAANPFNTLMEGNFAVLRGSEIFMQAGSYSEQLVLDKAVTLTAVGGSVVIGN